LTLTAHVHVVSTGFRVRGSGFGVQGSGFRVRGLRFRVQGLSITARAHAVSVQISLSSFVVCAMWLLLRVLTFIIILLLLSSFTFLTHRQSFHCPSLLLCFSLLFPLCPCLFPSLRLPPPPPLVFLTPSLDYPSIGALKGKRVNDGTEGKTPDGGGKLLGRFRGGNDSDEGSGDDSD
jgi:hypothetical protein